MFEQVGDQLFDDDAKASAITWTEPLIQCKATRRCDRIAKGSGASNVDPLPACWRFA